MPDGVREKTISYETYIFANELDKTVYMYEKTTEVGGGLSFGGGGSGTSFQSGKMLFRKVKSVQYGPDGKAYEIKLDLGAIPKAAKETAKKHGWKFKTVLSKSKALYPEGHSSAVPDNPPDRRTLQAKPPVPLLHSRNWPGPPRLKNPNRATATRKNRCTQRRVAKHLQG